MKATVLFLTVLGCTLAVPNGYYHQEYNYKTSSSSYRNNELQHKTDDQGYYKKDGDLEGRVRPRVDANSEHSEYVNPNLRNGDYRTGLIGSSNDDLTSYGQLRASRGSYGSHDLAAEGLAHSDHITGYSSGSYGASNSYGSSAQYGTSSNLRAVTSHLQQELERELQQAIQDNRAYSQSSRLGINELERELKQNLTNRLNSELLNRYGQQSIRGGLSYTISGGRLQSTANYDSQELSDLQRQLENSLLNQLRTQYNQGYAGSSSSHYEGVHGSSQSNYGYASTTTVRPIYYNQYPTTTYRPFTTIRPTYPVDYSNANYIRYTPVSNPESITSIASSVQNQLDTRLNQILDDVQRKYFSSSSSYSLTNTDVLLDRLREELRRNITYQLNEDIRRNYGTQVQRDDHMYTVGASGQTSNQYNYSIRDLERLRSQIEHNLIDKLNRDFERYRSSWSQQYHQSSHSSQQSYGGYNTPRYDIYSTPRYVPTTPRYDVYSTPHYNSYDSDIEHLSTRPSSSHITSLISGSGGGSNQNRHYLVAGSGQSGYEVGSSSSGSISQLQRQLQQDLSRQLQTAISRGHYGSYSSSGSYNPQSYQTSLQQLSDELNRNLTKQIQEYSSSSYYSTYGNVDQAQLANLRSQLQADLMRQLQQGLQQSYHSSTSYSSSSSSGNYRPTRGFENYQLGQYKTGGNVATFQGEDCIGDDPNAYTSHRMKRSYQPYRSRPIGLSYSGGYSSTGSSSDGYGGNYIGEGGYLGSYNRRNNPQLGQQQVEQLGQEVDESDLTQQVEGVGYARLQSQNQQQQELGQQVIDSDQTQQVEDPGFGKLQLGSQGQRQIELGQQIENSDEVQQIEDSGYGKLQLGSQNQQQLQLGQQFEDSDLTQQVEDLHSGKLQVGQQNQQQVVLGQQVEDSDDTQQVEDSGFGKLQLGSQGQQQIQLGQQVEDSDDTQQVEDSGFGKLQLGSQGQQQIQLGQQVEDSDLTQQVEDSKPGKLQIGLQSQQQIQLGQRPQHSGYRKPQVGQHTQQQIELGQDFGQNQQQSGTGKLQLGSQSQQQIQLGQQIDDSGETQQVEDSGFGKLQLGSQSQQQVQLRQQVEDSGDTQQVEDSGFGKLQIGSQSQQQVQLGQQVEDSGDTQQVEDSGFGKLQLGAQSQQQTQLGQQVDETSFNQQAESNRLGQLQFGSQQSQHQDNSDLTQQVEYPGFGQSQIAQSEFGQQDDLTRQHPENTGRLQFGSQEQQQITVGQPKLTQQQIQIANQLENELTEKLKEAIRNQQHEITYAVSDGSPSQSYQVSYQQLSNQLLRNLSKQLQNTETGANRYGTGYSYTISGKFNDQQLIALREKLRNDLLKKLQDDLSKSFSYSTSWSSSTNSQNNLGTLSVGNFKDFSQKQIQTANQLEKQLHNKLKDAVRTRYYTITYSGTRNVQPQLLYQNLINELQRNLTKELQAVGPTSTSYSYSYSFNNQQLDELRKQLEHDLKLQLEKEVSSITTSNSIGQQSADNLGLIQKHTDGTDVTQQVENSDLLQQTEDNESGKRQIGNQQQFENNGQQINVNGLSTSQVRGPSSLQNLNANQVRFTQQLGGDLSNQLRNAIKTYYSSTYTNQPFLAVYQQLLNELQRNITNQFQEIRTGHTRGRYSYSTYRSFSDEELVNLRKLIENNLKYQLQNEILLHDRQNSNLQQVGSHRGDISVQSQLEIGQRQDLSQQTDDNTLGSNQQQTEFGPGEVYDVTQQRQDNSYDKLQLGNQHNEQQSLNLDNHPQQVINNKLESQQFGQQQTVEQPIEPEEIDQTQQIQKSQVPLTQQQTDLNQQVDINYPTHLHIPSANLQFGGRPVTSRPVDSNRFLQTEIDQQRQGIVDANLQISGQQQANQKPVYLPTLTQDIQQTLDDQYEYNRELPNKVEPLKVSENKDDLTQRIDLNQQVDGSVSQIPDVEGENSLLIQKLREHVNTRPSQSTSDERLTYTRYNQPTRQGGYDIYRYRGEGPDSYGTQISSIRSTPGQEINQQESIELGLNQQQIQFAEQLEDKLSKQLQEAVNQNYQFVTHSTSDSPNSQLYQISYQQLSEDLQKNLTKQLDELLNGSRQHGSSSFSYSVYGSLSNQQQQTLLNRLLAELLRQLQQKLQVSYGLQYTSNYNTYGTNSEFPSTLVGHNQIHYVQPGQVQQNFETTSDLKPIEPQHASVVQNVESLDDSIGIKVHKGSNAHAAGISTSSSLSQPPGVSITAQGTINQNETPAVVDENVPWWKRIGNKVRQGAHDLKDKIIG